MSANDLADRLKYWSTTPYTGPNVAKDLRAAAALLREQAEQLDTLRNAIGDPDLLLDRAAALRSANTHRRLSDYLVALADAADALAAAGGGVPEEGATDEQ